MTATARTPPMLLDREKRGVRVYYRARTDALASLGALIGCPPS
jgi:ArsR family transcriptional regulator